ncbi:MAG: serine/threonine-protein phosphatase [Burkholderiales bacterium]|nr:serine/threonine-protein phosphatase [Burkholderiales bacterium]
MNHARLKDIAGVTDAGRRRAANDDRMAWDAQLGLALIADGVGGHNAGEIASLAAARSIRADLRMALCAAGGERAGNRQERRAALVHELVRRANSRVREAAGRSLALAGMGTTLALALLDEDFATIASVGDSRVYRMREGELERLTHDPFALAGMIERGCVRAGEARRSGLKNARGRVLGMPGRIEPDLTQHPLAPDDLFLLCSDGLISAVTEEEIGSILREAGTNLRHAAERAVALANGRGGRDNVSVVLARVA